MKLSVIICTYNRSSFLSKGLSAIADQMDLLYIDEVETLVVDNNSSDDTAEVFKEFQLSHPNMNLRYFLEKQQGLSYSRNTGVKSAKGEFVAFVDDDAVIGPHWMSCLFDAICHVDAQVFGGPIYPRFEEPCPEWIDPKYFVRTFASNNGYLKGISANEGFAGGNVCFKKDIFDLIGLFDTSIGMKGNTLGLGEETELFSRLSKSSYGAKLYNLEEMSILHFEAAYKLDPTYVENRIVLSGEQSSKRFLQSGKWLGYLFIFAKTLKQLLFSGYYFLKIPVAKANKFKSLKCIWVVKGLIKGLTSA